MAQSWTSPLVPVLDISTRLQGLLVYSILKIIVHLQISYFQLHGNALTCNTFIACIINQPGVYPGWITT